MGLSSGCRARLPPLYVQSHLPSLGRASSFSTGSFEGRAIHSVGRKLFSSFGVGDGPSIQNVGKEQMEEILDDYESGGREDSGYVVIDVREPHEIAMTGKLSPHTHTLPLGVLVQHNVFGLDGDEFEEICGFAKPDPSETLVFSCAAGIRSTHACNFAAQNGYSNLVNYSGGANEWFS
jgi:rhodanese-related sulfurtransferase